MPKLPTYQEVGIRDPRASYKGPSYPANDAVLEAEAQQGKALAGLGNTLAGTAVAAMNDQKKEADLLEWARADADVTTRTAKLNAMRDAETDPDKLGGFEDAHRQIVTEAASNLRDPDKAALWRTRHEASIADQGIRSSARAKQLRNDTTLAEDDGRLTNLELQAERAGSPEELNQIIKNGQSLVDLQARNGLITQRKAAEGQRSIAERFFTRYFQGKPASERAELLGPDEKLPATGDGFPRSLISTESGGDFGASNNVPGAGGTGHFGRLQFSRARMKEAADAGVIPQGTTPDEFMRSPDLQQKAERWHFRDIDNVIVANGFDKMVGQNVAGVPLTINGLRAVAHLGGSAGMVKFVETNGGYNPADANGTSLKSYFSRHGSGGTISGDQPATVQRVAATDAGADAERVTREGGPRMVLSASSPLPLQGAPLAPGSTWDGGGGPAAASATTSPSVAPAGPPSPVAYALSQLPYESRQRLRAQARSDLAQQQRDTERSMQTQKAEVSGLIRDDLASVERSGKGVDSLTGDRVRQALGEEAATRWQSERGRSRRIFETLDGIEMLPEGQIEQRLQGMEPQAGQPGYVEDAETYKRVRDRASKIIEVRRSDPAMAVDDFPTVKAAKVGAEYAQVGDKQVITPQSARRIVQARLDAQEQLGVVEPSAVTKSQARAIARQLRGAQDDDDKLRAVVGDMHRMYGDLADEVLVGTIQSMNVNRELAESANDMLRTFARGDRPSTQQARRTDTLRDDQTATDTMQGRPSAGSSAVGGLLGDRGAGVGAAVGRSIGRPAASDATANLSTAPVAPAEGGKPSEPAKRAEPKPVLGGSVSGDDLRRLWEGRNDPNMIEKFNQVFGSDTDRSPAQKVLKEIERSMPKRQAGR